MLHKGIQTPADLENVKRMFNNVARVLGIYHFGQASDQSDPRRNMILCVHRIGVLHTHGGGGRKMAPRDLEFN